MNIWTKIWRSLNRDYHDSTLPQADRQHARYAMRGAARRAANLTAKPESKIPPKLGRPGR